MAIYKINKGINKPIEFKGLKAQYIGYLGGGLVILLIAFALLYLFGIPVILCVILISAATAVLFHQVFRMSKKYGEHGLMKATAKRLLPDFLRFSNRKLFTGLKTRP
ncbi:DUF4133 domain-containing protein [Mucilaginibacter conchicola]|uniref:DUF4133 domain-containing protein n=1 Tax=Mucilaginibacter conchicola TaxID=2303333 RepID=A0A372NM85_9SPHI|nr:DUF4133 domain-containing protein [Mucilaginibacter conchicola]RFZ90051.1 DUF4133 domain-containing protein [Mucilaginibacter conchicola]